MAAYENNFQGAVFWERPAERAENFDPPPLEERLPPWILNFKFRSFMGLEKEDNFTWNVFKGGDIPTDFSIQGGGRPSVFQGGRPLSFLGGDVPPIPP